MTRSSSTSTQLEQGMRQSMVTSASMQLFLRALQATHMELTQLATQALNTNPALEEAPPLPRQEESAPAHSAAATLHHDFVIDSLPQQTTLSAHLEEQVLQSALPGAVEQAALQLLGLLDARGYFAEAPESLQLPPALLHKALSVVQDLEPAGVGARDLRESLLLQLRREGYGGSLAEQLILREWDSLVRHRYAEAARALGATESEVAAAAHHISRLNPDPGSLFTPAESHIITPDVLVRRLAGGELSVSLTGERIPRLTLSAHYRDMLAEHSDQPELRRYLSTCFREGRELIQAIEKRQNTILAIARAIVQRQRPFFMRGAAHLSPLKMEEIAADTQLHISTVSRAVNGKYLRCDHGVYELRAFFTAALPGADSGADISSARIRARIRALVDAEPPQKPLSDAALEKLLAAEGIRVARRTIAKYRDQLRILPAAMRKR